MDVLLLFLLYGVRVLNASNALHVTVLHVIVAFKTSNVYEFSCSTWFLRIIRHTYKIIHTACTPHSSTYGQRHGEGERSGRVVRVIITVVYSGHG